MSGQTSSPVNLDALTNVFTGNVREAIRTQLQEGVLAFGGTGAADLNQTLLNANPLTADLVPLTDVLATRSPQLDNLNNEFDTITAKLASEDANLRPLVANLDTTLGALAAREADLQGTLVHAANVFADLNQALSNPATQADLAHIFAASPQALSCAARDADVPRPHHQRRQPVHLVQGPVQPRHPARRLRHRDRLQHPAEPVRPRRSDNSLRVDQFLPLPGYTSHDSGGLTLEPQRLREHGRDQLL